MSPYSYIIVHCCDTESIHYSAYQLFKAESQGRTVFLKRMTGYLNISHIAETLLAKGINLTSLALMHAPSGIAKTNTWATYEEYHVRHI